MRNTKNNIRLLSLTVLVLFGLTCNGVGNTLESMSSSQLIFSNSQIDEKSYEQEKSDTYSTNDSALSLFFTENKGQLPEYISYYVNYRQGLVGFGESQVFFVFEGQMNNLTFADAKPVKPKGIELLESYSNYFYGSESYEQVPHYSIISYEELYNGITLEFKFTKEGLIYDFIIESFANREEVHMTYTGMTSITPPLIELAVDHVKLNSERSVERFTADSLICSYSTYLGGFGSDYGKDVVTDANGNVIITGTSSSADLPTKNAFQEYNKYVDLFIAKFSADGQSLIFLTYLGGSSGDGQKSELYENPQNGMAIDSNGNIVVTGYTGSSDFPTKDAYQENHGGGDWDAFVTKLSSDGQSLIFSTYLGGDDNDNGVDVAIDGSGNVVVTGFTESPNFPTKDAYQENHGGGDWDAFVTKFSSDGQSLIFSTYLGGSNAYDFGYSVAVDATGNIIISGYTMSGDFPTKNAFQDSNKGSRDIFVTKFNTDGQSLIFSTFIGGSGADRSYSIAIDANNNIIVVGRTDSTDFPTANAYQGTKGGREDIILVKISTDGQTLIFSTYLGSNANQDDHGYGVAVDGSGNVIITGFTKPMTSSDFPTVNPYQENHGGKEDAFVTKFSADGLSLIFSTYLGGSQDDRGYGVTVDGSGNVIVTGFTMSTDFPVVNAYQSTHPSSPCNVFISSFAAYSADTETTGTETTGTETTGTGTTGAENGLTPGFELLTVLFGLVSVSVLVARKRNYL